MYWNTNTIWMVLEMEIHFDPLFGILVCFFPFFLLLLFVTITVTKSRLKEVAKTRRKLQEGTYNHLFSNPKYRMVFRIAGGVMSIFSVGLLVALSLLIYMLGKTVEPDNRVYWFGIIIPPMVCLITIGVGILLLIVYKEWKRTYGAPPIPPENENPDRK